MSNFNNYSNVHANSAVEEEEAYILTAGSRLPFCQVGMVVHDNDCRECNDVGGFIWQCSWLVCDIYDDDETERWGMIATLKLLNGKRREALCQTLRSSYRLAQDFDSSKNHTGRWAAARAEVER